MDVAQAARNARQASRHLMRTSDGARREFLQTMVDALEAGRDDIAAANRQDLADAQVSPAMLARLELRPEKLSATLEGVRQIIAMDDPLGQVKRSTHIVDGPNLWQVTTPLGVVATIFESRPDVCIQIPALCLRSGNSAILKGGKEAQHTNQAIVSCIHQALRDCDLPEAAVTLLEGREEVAELLDCDDDVDLIVPRGSNSLVRHIQQSTHIPVMGHAAGICHIYVDQGADLAKAATLILDAKMDAPSACNAVETVLVHEAHKAWIPELISALESAGATVHQDDADFDKEYGAPELNLCRVPDLDGALAHIATHGSGHTEVIVTTDAKAARSFVDGVDAAGVFVNASPRFADGQRYGLGAEVGISTNKFHARGPVGLDGLTTTRWIAVGDGDVVAGHGAYQHEPLDGSWQEALHG